MLQLIARHRIAGPSPGHRRLADPDCLLKIAELADSGRDNPSKFDLSRSFSEVLHDIRMGGAWKRTGPRRLAQTEQMLLKHLAPAHRNNVTLLDLGASDGITTFDLLHAFRQAGYTKVSAHATDLNLSLYRFRLGPFVEYRAADGEPIMARLGPLGLRLARQRHDIGGSDMFATWYLRSKNLRDAMRMDARITLVNPLVRSNASIAVSELNCLERNDMFVNKFAAARASNILNPGYFDPSQIACAIAHLHAYIYEGGCLVVSRNADTPEGEVENGSTWLKRLNRFERVADFGSGSEVKAIVDNWSATQ